MAKQNRNNWFDSIAHVKLTPSKTSTDTPITEEIANVASNIENSDAETPSTDITKDHSDDSTPINSESSTVTDLPQEVTPPTASSPQVVQEPKASYDKMKKQTTIVKKESKKNDARKRAKREKTTKKKASSKNQYITVRISSGPYKNLISRYPLMSKTILVDAVVELFLNMSKKETDQWLNDQCGGIEKF